jgi:hypothetical protein
VSSKQKARHPVGLKILAYKKLKIHPTQTILGFSGPFLGS